MFAHKLVYRAVQLVAPLLLVTSYNISFLGYHGFQLLPMSCSDMVGHPLEGKDGSSGVGVFFCFSSLGQWETQSLRYITLQAYVQGARR